MESAESRAASPSPAPAPAPAPAVGSPAAPWSEARQWLPLQAHYGGIGAARDDEEEEQREEEEVGVFPLDVHNARLLDLVAPRGRANPAVAADFEFDLVAIGAGAGGLVSSKQSARRGWRSALVERHLAGGDCLNVGCVPSKALLRCARAVKAVKQRSQFGVRLRPRAQAPGSNAPGSKSSNAPGFNASDVDADVDVDVDVDVDFGAVMERMRRLRAHIAPADSYEGAEKLGVSVFRGNAVFTSAHSVEVGGQTLRFRKAVIATGARATLPDIPGLQSVPFVTNASVFNLAALPRRLCVVGGGPIGCELGQAFRAFGSEVTVLLRGSRVLPGEDVDAADAVAAALAADGVALQTSVDILRVEPVPGPAGEDLAGEKVGMGPPGPAGPVAATRVVARDGRSFECDCLLVATGRTANVEGLGLEAAGVALDASGGLSLVATDDLMRTSNPDVFAVGDVASTSRFTHLSGTHAQMVVDNALFDGARSKASVVCPRVTFTEPEVATVGLTEAAAAAQGVAVDVYVARLLHNDRAVVDGETGGFAKALCKKGSDVILGACIVTEGAGEMISELTLAMQCGIGLGPGGLGATVHPYPTKSDVVGGLCFQYKMKTWQTKSTSTTTSSGGD